MLDGEPVAKACGVNKDNKMAHEAWAQFQRTTA